MSSSRQRADSAGSASTESTEGPPRPVPRFVIPLPSDSVTRHTSVRGGGATTGSVQLEHVVNNVSPRVCSKCNQRQTMVPWRDDETLICLAPVPSSLLRGTLITCGHAVHTRLTPQVCPTKDCRGAAMSLECHFGVVGYACVECRRFESVPDMERRMAKEEAKRAKAAAKKK